MQANRNLSSVGVFAAWCVASGLMVSCSGGGDGSKNREVSGAPDRFAEVNTIAHDRGVWEQLLTDHGSIRRTVVYTTTGAEATTESDDPTVAARIKEHAKAMQTRVRVGAPVRGWDGVFVDLFAKHEAIRLEITPTEHGVKIVESTDDPAVVATLWSHASGLCDFVREGHAAGERPTPRIAMGAPGATPPAEVAIGGVKHRLLLGQPAAGQMAALQAAGVRTVVNFRKPGEHPGYDEAGAAKSAGLGYVNLPYAGAGELTDEILDAARASLREAGAKGETVALHCRTGNRVGPAWVAYRALDGGVDVERAIAEAKAARMVDPALEARVREYIKARAGSVTPRG